MRIKPILIILNLLIVFILFNANVFANQAIEYYRHADFTPTYNLRLRYPISEDEAQIVKCYRITYDDRNRPILAEYLENGKLKEHFFKNSLTWTATVKISYSENIKNILFFKSKGENSFNSRVASRIKVETDSLEKTVRLFAYAATDSNKLEEDSTGVAKYLFQPNKQGFWVESYFDAKGNPIVQKSGYFYHLYRFSSEGDVVFEFGLDEEFELIQDEDQTALVKRIYDDFGNPILVTYFDATENEVVSLKQKFDSNGYLIEIGKYSPNGERVYWDWSNYTLLSLLSNKGYSGIKNKYDNAGNQLEAAFYGIDGELVDGSQGWAKVQYTYNQWNQRTSEEYLDQNLHLVIPSGSIFEAYAKAEWKYDLFSPELVKESRYYGPDNKLMLINGGYSIEKRDYSGQQLIRRSYLGKTEKLINSTYGYAQEVYVHDQHGNRIEHKFLDKNNKLVNNNDGYAILRWLYDQEHFCYEVRSFDYKYRPTGITKNKKISGGYVSEEFNKSGKIIQKNRFENGMLYRETYDRFGRLKDNTSFKI